MLVEPNIRELERRRQLLLTQSGLHRATLDLDLTTAGESFRWLDAGVRLGRRAGPWLMAAVPIVGFLAARKSFRFWSVARRSVPLVRTALKLLRR